MQGHFAATTAVTRTRSQPRHLRASHAQHQQWRSPRQDATRWPNTLKGVTNPAHITKRCTMQGTLADIVDLLASCDDDNDDDGFAYFDPICLSAACNRLGKLANETSRRRIAFPANLPRVFARLVDKIEQSTADLDGRHISNMLHGIAVSGFFTVVALEPIARRLYSALVDEFETRQFQPQLFSPQAIANIAWSLATVHWDSNVYAAVSGLTASLRSLAEFKPQELANLCWALSKVGHKDYALLERVAVECQARRFAGFNPQNVSNLLWAMAAVEFRSDGFTAAVLAHLTDDELRAFNAQDLSNLAWSFATLHCKHDEFFARLANAARKRLRAFEAQHMGTMAWAFAQLGIRSERLFSALADELAARNLATVESQHLANLVWALVSLAFPSQALLHRIADHLTARGFAAFDVPSISRIAVAFAKSSKDANVIVLGMFSRLAADVAAPGVLERFRGVDVAELASAFARVSARDAPFERIARHCTGVVRHWRPDDLAALFRAFAHAGHVDAELCGALQAEVTARSLNAFDTQRLVDIAWAASALACHEARSLVNSIALACASRPVLTLHGLADLAWALCCAELLGEPHARVLLSRDPGDFDAASHALACQLRIVAAAWRIDVGDDGGELPAFLCRAKATVQAADAEDDGKPVPDAHRAIARKLEAAGYAVAHNVPASEGLCVDLLVTRTDGLKYGIELHGMRHWLSDGRTLHGRAALKRRLLRKAVPRFLVVNEHAGGAAGVVEAMKTLG